MGEKSAMTMARMLSMSLERNSMLGMSEKVWLIRCKEETMMILDMIPSVAMRRRAVWRFLLFWFVIIF